MGDVMPDIKRSSDHLHDAASEVIEAARAQGVWTDADGGDERWVTLALPAVLLDRLAAGLDDAR